MGLVLRTSQYTRKWTALVVHGGPTPIQAGKSFSLSAVDNVGYYPADSLKVAVTSTLSCTPSASTSIRIGQKSSLNKRGSCNTLNTPPHINMSVECLGATLNSATAQWSVQLRDLMTGLAFTQRSTVFVSAVGGILFPRDVSAR